eukprot:CAMPEP_0202901654 /NCGR_PEP_ID=MMETSP1392-20130828/14378_1 /ASSEMBLY_ACC=CAM_ASM_000868 /TAXON_ID=225041 /ORGANISM="Chlamydomonas chlamydogama, Strain SAG 11-48b" /LENGTH=238 /DNA_ID=CAMNT_0049588247 /DNA_START=80 /DNA_END=796 /DNA_ORIENTATION=-
MANVVFGAGGPTGFECVQRLLEVSTDPVRAVVRNPDKYQGTFPRSERLAVVKGDVTDLASCKEACKDAKGVIFAAAGKDYFSPHAVDFMGVANVAEAAKEAGASRVVLVSSMMVTKKNNWKPLRILLNNIRYSLMDNKLRGEDALRKSGVPYTIVRPGGLARGPGGAATLLTGQGDNKIAGSTSISRADVAAVCVEALTNPGARGVTFELVAQASGTAVQPLAQQLASIWSGLKPDSA